MRDHLAIQKAFTAFNCEHTAWASDRSAEFLSISNKTKTDFN